MFKKLKTTALGAAVLMVSSAAIAQTPATPTGASKAAPAYTSAFGDYRPFAAEEVVDWRQANETVREIGGWRAYAREIHGTHKPAQTQPPGPAAAPQPVAPASPGAPKLPADPHRGHH